MATMQNAAEALDMLMNRTAEYKAFEASLRELNSTLVDLLGTRQAAPDIAGPLAAALQGLKFPQPVVNSPVTVATSGAQKGDSWRIEYSRTPQGATMTVTKL